MKNFLAILVLLIFIISNINAQSVLPSKQKHDEERISSEKRKISKQINKIQLPKSDIKLAPTPKIVPPVDNDNYSTTPVRTKLVRRKVRKRIDNYTSNGEKCTVIRKVLKGVKKVRGFRILAYFGGNNRISRQEAERIGHKVKQLFPQQPIYVHFYLPRWMCQIGNFTSYKAAYKVLRKLKKEGYKKANIIRTMVTIKTTKFIDDPILDYDIY